MIEVQEKEIRGRTYRVAQLGSTLGRRTLTRLVQAIGPSLAELIKSEGEGIDLASTAGAIATFSRDLKDADLEYLCSTFAKVTEVQGEDADAWLPLDKHLDLHFAGKYGAMFEWLWFCLEVNYSDFFDASSASGPMRAALEAMKTKASPSIRTSIGSPTE